MKKFEYRLFNYQSLNSHFEITKNLNEIGQEGQEAVQINQTDYGYSGSLNLKIWAKRDSK